MCWLLLAALLVGWATLPSPALASEPFELTVQLPGCHGAKIIDSAAGLGQDDRALAREGAWAICAEPSRRMTELGRMIEAQEAEDFKGCVTWVRAWSETLPFFPYASANPLESILARDCSSPSKVAEATELADRIEEVLLKMKESHREVIILSYLCGMSHRDVALVMGFTNETAVRKALSRAMHRVQVALEVNKEM